MLEIAFTQHAGKAHPVQQDALWTGEKCIQLSDSGTASLVLDPPLLLAIADGVAISPQPQTASRFVVEDLAQRTEEEGLSARTVRKVHGALCDRFARGKTFGTSTTLVAAYITGKTCQVMNVGDSRCYLITDHGSWTQVSHDHTVLNDLRETHLVDDGTKYASMYDALSDCLIADDEEDQFAIHQRQLFLQPADTLLLCSDGVHDTLGDERLCELYDPKLDTLAQVQVFRKAVLRAGAPDNFSIILARQVALQSA
jgi:serine/threonine protein phosphatase PrpC